MSPVSSRSPEPRGSLFTGQLAAGGENGAGGREDSKEGGAPTPLAGPQSASNLLRTLCEYPNTLSLSPGHQKG